MGDVPADVDLNSDERAEIDGFYLRVPTANHYELLGVDVASDRRAIRDAYFELSKKFHPDAWFGRKTGAWKLRIEEIFRAVTQAYDVLSNRNARTAYDATIGVISTHAVETAPRPAVPQPTPAAAGAGAPRRESVPMMSPIASTSPAVDPRPQAHAPVVPQRPTEPAGPTVDRSAAAVEIDHDAARRAAREALARRMAHGSGTVSAVRAPTNPGVPVAPNADTSGKVSALASMQAARTVRDEAERKAKLAQYLRLAEESVHRSDFVGAANTLQLALTLAPDDAALKARHEEMATKATATQCERYIEQARQLERVNKWEAAAEAWQRALVGRPKDPGILLRAGNALLRTGKELQKAADLARRATQVAPKSLEAYALLADVYIKGGLKASAQVAIESAAKLDPTSPIVKDLYARLKAS